MVAGSAGTGKTTFAQKFRSRGAKKGEQGIYFTTFSEPTEVAYSVDGIVILSMDEERETRRKHLEVLKMRGTKHVTGKQPVDITISDGIAVLKSQF